MPLVAVPNLAMLESPRTDARQVNEGLWGEVLHVVSEADNGYIECRLQHDGYRGYVLKKNMAVKEATSVTGTSVPEPDALYVVTRASLLFSEPDIKSRIVCRLPLLSRIVVSNPDQTFAQRSAEERFIPTSDGYFALAQHLSAMSHNHRSEASQSLAPRSPIEWAESLFLGAPYLWGGRTPDGCDCSGLVQSVATLSGHLLPRDSKPQEQFIPLEIQTSERQRGDLVFWPGHVGILASSDLLLHANAHSMDCRLEPLEYVMARAGEPSSIRRLQ